MHKEYVIFHYKMFQRNFLWIHFLSKQCSKYSRWNYKNSSMRQSSDLSLQWGSNETKILFLICTSPSIHIPSWVQNIFVVHSYQIFISAEPQEMKQSLPNGWRQWKHLLNIPGLFKPNILEGFLIRDRIFSNDSSKYH